MIEQANNPGKTEDSTSQLPWTPRIVHIRATIHDLNSALIPFAVLKSDPIPDFQRIIEENLHESEDWSENLLAIQEAWNQPFTQLLDEQIFFLYAWSTIPGASPKMRSSAGLSFAIATPGPLYQRWLTTFAIERQGELVAWSQAIDMRDTGQDQVDELLLSEENMIRLYQTAISNSKFKTLSPLS